MGVYRLNLALRLFGCGCALTACHAETDIGARDPRADVAAASFLLENNSGCDSPYGVGEAHVSTGGFFNVHYVRTGLHAVPSRDTDADGVPDYVQTVAKDFDEVVSFYQQLGYRTPRYDGGEAHFDVYLVDFGTSADGQYCRGTCAADGCSGHMLLENDFNGRNYPSQDHAIRLVASHEFFHAVQAAYTTEASTILAEGTAVWASEAFDADTGDLERQVPAYLAQPERSLRVDPTGGFDAYNYGGSLLFAFLDQHVQRTVIRELWEKLAEDPSGDIARWPSALDSVLQAHDTNLAAAFGDFVEWNLYTGKRADPQHSYAQGAAFPAVTERALDGAFSDDAVRTFPLSARYYALPASAGSTLAAAATLTNDPGGTGLGLLVASERDGKISAVARAADEPGHRVSLQLPAAGTLHVVLYNTRASGESVRPDLCIGSEADVEACRNGEKPEPESGSQAPATPDAGEAARDAGSSQDAGEPADVDAGIKTQPQSNSDDSGCSVAWRPHTASSAFSVLLAAFTLLLRRRTRR